MEARMNAVWNNSRCAELDTFTKLLSEVQGINHGSGCLERIARCIELAKALDEFDYTGDRPSFRNFLRELAIADRFPAPHAPLSSAPAPDVTSHFPAG